MDNNLPNPLDEAEIDRILAMSDEEVWDESVRLHGSVGAAKRAVERTRQQILDLCAKHTRH
jgi:hypothetical protein